MKHQGRKKLVWSKPPPSTSKTCIYTNEIKFIIFATNQQWQFNRERGEREINIIAFLECKIAYHSKLHAETFSRTFWLRKLLFESSNTSGIWYSSVKYILESIPSIKILEIPTQKLCFVAGIFLVTAKKNHPAYFVEIEKEIKRNLSAWRP